MAAIWSGEIFGELGFEGSDSHWFFNLYATVSFSLVGPKDWEIVKRCVHEANEVSVISEPGVVLDSVRRGDGVSQGREKLQNAGQSVPYMLWNIMMKQAEADVDLKIMGNEVAFHARAQKVYALLNAVFSLAPLGGTTPAITIAPLADALPLVESILFDRAWLQDADTPLLLDKFVFRVNSIINYEGALRVTPESHTKVVGAVRGLGMPWGEFREMVPKAAARRGMTGAASCSRVDDQGDKAFVMDQFRPYAPHPFDISAGLMGNAATRLARLKASVLSGASVNGSPGERQFRSPDSGTSLRPVALTSVSGEGGIGKTSTCKLLCADEEVRAHFSDGAIFWIDISKDATEEKVKDGLGSAVLSCGGWRSAGLIRSRSGIQYGVEVARVFFSKRRVLVILDNVWDTPPNSLNSNVVSWAATLSRIASCPGSAVIMTTRSITLP